jgi:hypothetical protein
MAVDPVHVFFEDSKQGEIETLEDLRGMRCESTGQLREGQQRQELGEVNNDPSIGGRLLHGYEESRIGEEPRNPEM